MSSDPDARTATAHDFADARFAIHAITARLRESERDPAWLRAVGEEAALLWGDVRELHDAIRRAVLRGVRGDMS